MFRIRSTQESILVPNQTLSQNKKAPRAGLFTQLSETGFSKAIRKGIAAFYLFVPPSLVSSSYASKALANEIKQSSNIQENDQAVINFALEAWGIIKEALDNDKNLDEMPNKENLINNIIAAFHVSDDTNIKKVDEVRAEIIKRGATDPRISPRLVQSALYTSAVLAKKVNEDLEKYKKELEALNNELEKINEKEAKHPTDTTDYVLVPRKIDLEAQIAKINAEVNPLNAQREQIAARALDYLGNEIVDISTLKDGRVARRVRQLLLPDEAKKIEAKNPSTVNIYNEQDFSRLAAYVIASANNPIVIDAITQELIASSNDPIRQEMLLDIFYLLPEGTKVSQEVIDLVLEKTFGREQLKKYKDELEKLSKQKPGEQKPSEQKPTFEIKSTDDQKQEVIIKLVTQDPSTTIPGATGEVGSLEVLKEINPKLLYPKLPYQFAKFTGDEEGEETEAQKLEREKAKKEQEKTATKILLLAQNKHEFALPLVSQWFAMRPYRAGLRTAGRVQDSDLIVLRALAILAQKDKQAFEILCRIASTHPNLVIYEALIRGNINHNYTPSRLAGHDVKKAFQANHEGAKLWLASLADRKAKLILPEPTQEGQITTVDSIRKIAHDNAMQVMAYFDNSHAFSDYLRNIVKRPVVNKDDLYTAIYGLGIAKDEKAIEPLLDIANDEKQGPMIRDLAFDTVAIIDTPDIIPEEILKKAFFDSPFSPHMVQYYHGKKDPLTNLLQDIDASELQLAGVNPFEHRIQRGFQNFLIQQQEQANLSLRRGIATKDNSLEALLYLSNQEFAGKRGVLLRRAQDPVFKEKYLAPMVRYLDRCKDKKDLLNINLATSMMRVLAKAQCEEAAPSIACFAIDPEAYATDSLQEGYFAMQSNSYNTPVLKAAALQALGHVANLAANNCPNANVLHDEIKGGDSDTYRNISLSSLRALAKRYNERMKTAKGPELDALTQARNLHMEKTLGHLKLCRKAQDETTQLRVTRLNLQVAYSRIIDLLGGRKELLVIVQDSLKDDPRASIARSIVNALISNGCKALDICSLGFDDSTTKVLLALYQDIETSEYFLGPASNQKYTGKGVQAVVCDGGYPLYPSSNIKYPERFIEWGRLDEFRDLHPTEVTSNLCRYAPDIEIIPYSVLGTSYPEIPFKQISTQQALPSALEDVAERTIKGEISPEAINYSFIYFNYQMHDPVLRSQYFDLVSAFMELLSRMGVKHSVAAGNFQGANDRWFKYGALGSTTNLGLRIDKNGNFIDPEGVFVASAMDFYANTLAEFSSKQDPHRKSAARKMISFNGVHVLTMWNEDGIWLWYPQNGTSFAAPAQVALFAWGRQARDEAELKPLTNKEWKWILENSTKMLEGREEYEGGRYIHVPTFLEEVLKPTPVPKENKQTSIRVTTDNEDTFYWWAASLQFLWAYTQIITGNGIT